MAKSGIGPAGSDRLSARPRSSRPDGRRRIPCAAKSQLPMGTTLRHQPGCRNRCPPYGLSPGSPSVEAHALPFRTCFGLTGAPEPWMLARNDPIDSMPTSEQDQAEEFAAAFRQVSRSAFLLARRLGRGTDEA